MHTHASLRFSIHFAPVSYTHLDVYKRQDNQLGYVTNVPAGCGLIRCAGNIVPFTNSFPKDTKLYKLMSTNPSEKKE